MHNILKCKTKTPKPSMKLQHCPQARLQYFILEVLPMNSSVKCK